MVMTEDQADIQAALEAAEKALSRPIVLTGIAEIDAEYRRGREAIANAIGLLHQLKAMPDGPDRDALLKELGRRYSVLESTATHMEAGPRYTDRWLLRCVWVCGYLVGTVKRIVRICRRR